jgi:hypothetical protein
MAELFSTGPCKYVTVKGNFRLIRTGGGSKKHRVPGAQKVWGMTTILFSIDSARRVEELIRSAQAEMRLREED